MSLSKATQKANLHLMQFILL